MTKYKDLNSIPLHCFLNKECTITTSKDLQKYLRYMFNTHPYDLEYLWRHSQQYTRHGGCSNLTFELWLAKLQRDLNKQEEEY